MKPPEVIWLRPERYLPWWFHSFVLQYFLPFFFFFFLSGFPLYVIHKQQILLHWNPQKPGLPTAEQQCPLSAANEKNLAAVDTGLRGRWNRQYNYNLATNVKLKCEQSCAGFGGSSKPVAFQEVKTRSRGEASLLLLMGHCWSCAAPINIFGWI